MKCTHTKIFVNTFLHFYENIFKKYFMNDVPGKKFLGCATGWQEPVKPRMFFFNGAEWKGCNRDGTPVESALANDQDG